MGWITKSLILIFCLAALHNWDLWCGSMSMEMINYNLAKQHFGYAIGFSISALIVLIHEMNIYYQSHKDKESTL